MQQQHAVSVALHMLWNNFFKLYDLNGDDCIKNNFHLFFNWMLFFIKNVLKELTVNIDMAGW